MRHQSNIGIFATAIVREYTTARESWWLGLEREAFQQRVQEEAPRMRYSAGAAWVAGLHTEFSNYGAKRLKWGHR